MAPDPPAPAPPRTYSYDDLRWMTDGIEETGKQADKNREKLQKMLKGYASSKSDILAPDKINLSRFFENTSPALNGDYKVGGAGLDAAHVEEKMPPEDVNPQSIDELYNVFKDASAPSDGDVEYWDAIRKNLGQAEASLHTWLGNAQRLADSDNGEGWAGSAGDTVRGYLRQFEGLTKDLEACAQNMHYAYRAYADSLKDFPGPVTDYYNAYHKLLDQAKKFYDGDELQAYQKKLDENARTFIDKVMKAYRARIVEAAKHPAVDQVTPPAAPTQVGGPGPGPGPGGVPKMPTMPDLDKLLNNKNAPNTPQKDNPASSIQPLTDAAQKGLEGLSDAASKATDAGQGALQAGLDGVKQLADSLTNGNPAGLNEGALNLGPGGLAGLNKLGGGPAGTGKAGGGGGAGARAPVMPKTGVQMAEATKAATGTPSASRAGLAAGAGSAGAPGAGAPAAGRGAGGGSDKEHKASKALRSKANGEAVAGVANSAAVIPVVGGETDTAPPSESAKR